MGKRASSIELSKEEREYLELQTRARTILVLCQDLAQVKMRFSSS